MTGNTIPNINSGVESLGRRKSFLELTAADSESVAAFRTSFLDAAPELIEDFYEHLLSHAPTAEFLRDPALVERLKQLQVKYFEELVSGEYGADYATKRLEVGRQHHQIGVEPQWYLGAYNAFIQRAFPTFAKSQGTEIPQQLLSLLKVILLDIGLTLEAYFAASTTRLRQHNEELEEALGMYFRTDIKARQYAKLAGHEIRGSLNAIGNVIAEIADDFSEALPEEAREALRSAGERCQHVTTVVDGILSEPENAGNQEWVETNDLLKDIRDRMPIYADGKTVELKLPGESVRVWADPIALREVFANLVSNAVHHLDKPQGQIRIEQRSSNGTLTFAVVDNGPGVSVAEQPHIFQPFYRTTVGQHNGKGLGLYFVRRIIEEHGGRVWMEPAADGGSRFLFSLPLEGGRPNGTEPHAA